MIAERIMKASKGQSAVSAQAMPYLDPNQGHRKGRGISFARAANRSAIDYSIVAFVAVALSRSLRGKTMTL